MAALFLYESPSPVCSTDPAAVGVPVRLHVILPLFSPEVRTDFHCSTQKYLQLQPVLPNISVPHVCKIMSSLNNDKSTPQCLPHQLSLCVFEVLNFEPLNFSK